MYNEQFQRLFDHLTHCHNVTPFFNEFFDFNDYIIVAEHEKLPVWWRENNNFILCHKNRKITNIPNITLHGGHEKCSNFIIICNEQSDFSVLVWGDGGILYSNPLSRIVGCNIALGSGCIVMGPWVRNSPGLKMNCRNGGRIVLHKDILIATGVSINTDDCHTIYSIVDGQRLNPFGGVVLFDEHVWIGQQATIMGNSSIGKHTVVGAFSFVRGKQYPDNVILAGTPAQVMARDVNWDFRDIPPGIDMRSGLP
jgi:acetyltransferase-like isoleucine patch superfamily enzyme